MKFAQTLLRIGDRILQGAARNVKHQSLTPYAKDKHALPFQRNSKQQHQQMKHFVSDARLNRNRAVREPMEQQGPNIKKRPGIHSKK